jgi:NAD(P)H dehydrogenase (quinone)
VSAPVLVVGASGKTGRAVARALLARGVPVRAAVRAGREEAAPPGTEPVPVDLESGLGLEAALSAARAAYHLAPNVHPDEVGMAARMADAAASVGLPRLVFHSVLHPDDARMPHHVRKGEAEVLLRQSLGERVTVLRPAAYHQNLLDQALAGVVVVPYSPDAPFTNVDLGDVAEVAASILLDPGVGGEVHDLAGPEQLTTRQMCAQAASLLGRAVDVREITIDAWLRGSGAGLPAAARESLVAMFETYDNEGLVGDPDTLTALLGRTPTTWAHVVGRHA